MRTFRRHGTHAVAIASEPHTLRAGADELQMTLHEIIDQSASSLGLQATSSYPATQEVNCIRPAGRAAPWRPAGPACRSLRWTSHTPAREGRELPCTCLDRATGGR